MAEALVRAINRDYVRFAEPTDARAVIAGLPGWIGHDNTIHPNKALGYRSPAEFIAATRPKEASLTEN